MAYDINELIGRLDAKYELVYVDYRDELLSDQIKHIMNNDMDSLWDSLAEYESESTWYGVEAVLEYTFSAEELGELSDEDKDLLVETIRERDNSDFLSGLLRNTSDVLVRYRIDEVEWDGENFDDYIVELAKMLGISAKHNKDALEEMAANANVSYYSPDLYLIFTMSLDDVVNLNYNPSKFMKVVNPGVLLLDTMNGSGFDGSVPLVWDAPFERDNLIWDDKKAGHGYAWDDVACPVHSAYSPDSLTFYNK